MLYNKAKQLASETWVERAMQLPGEADLHRLRALMESYVRDEARIIEIASLMS